MDLGQLEKQDALVEEDSLPEKKTGFEKFTDLVFLGAEFLIYKVFGRRINNCYICRSKTLRKNGFCRKHKEYGTGEKIIL